MKRIEGLPTTELEAADALLRSFAEHGINIDQFDRALLVTSGAVVTLPEIKPIASYNFLDRAKVVLGRLVYASLLQNETPADEDYLADILPF